MAKYRYQKHRKAKEVEVVYQIDNTGYQSWSNDVIISYKGSPVSVSGSYTHDLPKIMTIIPEICLFDSGVSNDISIERVQWR